MPQNPFTLLKESVDPTMAALMENDSFFNDEVINLLAYEDYTGIQPDAAGYIDIWQATSAPALNIGDYWAFVGGSKSLATGRIKCKKMTISVIRTHDEMERINSLGASNSILAKEELRLMKETFAYLKTTLRSWVYDPWGGVTTSEDYDKSYAGAFAPQALSGGGTLSLPADLNSTAGTSLDLQALNFSGTAQTYNNVTSMVSYIMNVMTKIDAVTKRVFRWKRFYWLVDPIFYSILKSNKDILNGTTKQTSANYYIDDLQAAGIYPIELEHISYTYSTGNTTVTTVVADPVEWFTFLNIPVAEGANWSEWEKRSENKDGKIVYQFEKHRMVEFAVLPTSFFLRTSATASYFFKPVARFTVTPYEN